MAKKAEVIITCDGTQVKRVLEEIDRRIKELTANRQALNQKVQAGVQLTKQEIAQDKKWEQEIKALTSAQKKNQAEYQRTRDVMRNLAGSTTQQLKRAYADLAKKLNQTTGEQVNRQEVLRRKMAEVQAQINRNTGAINNMSNAQKGFSGALGTTLKNLVAYAGVFALFNRAKGLLGDIVTKNRELSDSMANIRKVSQWAASDVEKLTNNLAKIETRNSLQTLQGLAYQGAKLGIGQYGVEGLTGFVRAAEQVQTALGEDLGEEALPALAKLTEVMGLIPKYGVEEAMQKAGSAIYQLGATSTATGKNIVEFSKRLMGLANVSGITADELLGLGSAADSMALMPEVAATAFNKLFNSIQSNTAGIANAVGIAKEELQGLIYEGRTMDALVKVFEKMQTMSMAELEGRGVFKELGSDGARLTNVMITMANKVDMLKSHLDVAHESFSKGKAVINEYLIQQETAAAYFERTANLWTKAFVNPEGVDIVKQLAQEWYNVSREMTHSVTTMTQIKLTLGLIAGTAKQLLQILPKLVQLMMFYGVASALQAIVRQFRAIYAASTMATAGVARFSALLKTNAIAIALTAVAMLVSKMYELSEASKAAAEEEERRQRVFTDAAAEALQTYREQVKALDKYKEALADANASEDERKENIRKFKQEFGSYLEKLGIEVNTYEDMAAAINRVNKELKDKAYYETGQRLRESYVGDARQEQTAAMSQYMQVAGKRGLSAEVMEQIIEGQMQSRAEAIDKAFQSMDNGDMLSKLYSKLSSNGISYVGLDDELREFIRQQFGEGTSITSVWESLQDVANAAGNLYDTSQEVIRRNEQVDKFIEENADNYSPQISVEGAIANLAKIKELNEEKLNEALNVLREEWKKMSEEDRQTERGQQIGSAIGQYSGQIRALRGEGYEAPPTKKELAAAENERLQKLRSDFKQSKEDVEGLIAKVDQWYNLQDAVINDFVASGRITDEEAAQALEAMKIARNVALEKARLAVASGDDTEWKKFYTDNMAKMMVDHGEWSSQLFKQITEVDIKALHDFLATFNGAEAMAKLDASSFFDTMRKKAAENRKTVSQTQAKAAEELDKMLLKYEYFDKAARQFAANLVQIGALGTTAEQMAQGMEGAPSAEETIEAVKAMLVSMLQQGTDLYKVNPADAKGVAGMIGKMVAGTDGEQGAWFNLFPDVKDWLANPEQHKKELEQIYNVMLRAEQDYYAKRKQSYENEQRRHETRFRAAGYTEQESLEQAQFKTQAEQKDAGIGATFWEQQGLGKIANDPEILAIQNRIYWRNKDVEDAQARLDALKAQQQQELGALKAKQDRELAMKAAANASEAEMDKLRAEHRQQTIDMEAAQNTQRMGAEDLLKEYRAKLFEQETLLGTKVAQELQKRVQTINSLSKPVTDFTKAAGRKIGDMIFNMESESATWEQLWKNMALAVGESVIEMTAQYAQNLIIQKAMNRASEAEAVADANVKVQAGIAAGSAKTIGELGWWGIPLVAVISALLMGLLQSALSAGGSKSSSSSASGTRTKLVSNMLTYDKGNIQRFVGQDGKVYTATEEPQPKDGLVTRPIATTVQGQPALVAENGPEIVIGRQTTRAIMMNEPELIRYLADYDRNHSRRGSYHPYDSGNAREVADSLPQGTDADRLTGDEARRLTTAIGQFVQSMDRLQQQGIQAYINMYGQDGLYEQQKRANRFMGRYAR